MLCLMRPWGVSAMRPRLAVGGDAFGGLEAGGHRGGRGRLSCKGSGGALPSLAVRAAFSTSRRLPVAMSRSGPSQVRLASLR